MTLAQRRAIARYRRLVLALADVSLGDVKSSFPPSVVFLIEYPDDAREWRVDGWTDCLRHDECRDRTVAAIRKIVKTLDEKGDKKTLAVWFMSLGWKSPNDGVRSSRHVKREQVLMVVESTLDGDKLFAMSLVEKRWQVGEGDCGSRFEDLIGREKHVGHLRVVSAKKES